MIYYIILILLGITNSILLYNRTRLIKDPKSDYIKTLLRQCARWAIAAENDKNIMIAVLHANYAAGYFWAMNDIATSCEIENITNINYIQFKNMILSIQDITTKKMSLLCPDWTPKSTLTRIAGNKF